MLLSSPSVFGNNIDSLKISRAKFYLDKSSEYQDLDSVKLYLHKSLDELHENPNDSLKQLSLKKLGSCLMKLSKYEDARNTFDSLAYLSIRLKDSLTVAIAKANIAGTFISQGFNDTSMIINHEVADILWAIRDTNRWASVMSNLELAKIINGQFE